MKSIWISRVNAGDAWPLSDWFGMRTLKVPESVGAYGCSAVIVELIIDLSTKTEKPKTD